ncbi:C-type lectin domain family 4 member E-like [Puntigrus tetrazona]|uniref:C-type lectin domain family 4 member E-like n=1 Tax=Puntigrus tetrazona TaxID=1606681 RepID=UPI001C89B47E|nr:C-type lectin domain family 4 member E-like [Puntigrus tetrazona]
MDSIYENSAIILEAVASDEKRPQCDGNTNKEQKREKEVCPSKWIKVFMFVFAVCFSLALGGLCILGILYLRVSLQSANSKKEFEVLRNHHEEALRKLNRFSNSTGCPLCAVHWIHSEAKCYYFSTVKKNWTQSRDQCVTLGGHLVMINSKEEQDFVTSNVKETHWIGLNDLDTEGHWVWVNSQPLNNSLQFWMKRKNEISEPDNWTKEHPDGEDCAGLGHVNGETDLWTDAYCFEEKRFVCEVAAAV